MKRLSDRLQYVRQQRFVGRTAERTLFDAMLAGTGDPPVVLHICGSGGVGKTTLLHELARLAAAGNRAVLHLDARQFEARPDSFADAFKQRLAAGWQAVPPRLVLFVDTYELLAPLDGWLRSEFLPEFPDDALVVIAGRHAPIDWRADALWSPVTRVVLLNNLDRHDSRAYLRARGVPDERHAAALDFTHGHPLALSLLADMYTQNAATISTDLADQHEVVQHLLLRFLDDVPTPRHRTALELAALVRTTTESMLAAVFGEQSAFELFRWMRGLSFMEVGPSGLFPHDLVREALEQDLRWRDPAGCHQLQQAALTFLFGQVERTDGVERQRLRMEILFMHRRDPGMKDFFAWDVADVAYAEAARLTDHRAITTMVERFEGAQSAAIVRYWLGRQPAQFLAYRTSEGALYGFMLQLLLQHTTDEDAAVDPAIAAVQTFVAQRRPLRSGEAATYMRFWMGSASYQDISPVVNITAANCVIHWTTIPNLVWSFVAMANPQLMRPHFESIRFPRSPDADFVVGERHYGIFSHDWQADPVDVWRADTKHAAVMPAVKDRAEPRVLEGDELAVAVRQALRDATRHDLLATNPLLYSTVLDDTQRSPEDLQALLRQVVEQFKANPKDAKFYRAVWYTYIEPEPTQEAVAERLALPFNTYRYHLAKGIERMIAELARRAAAAT